VAFLHADSPGALAGQLRAQEALQHRAGWLIAFRGGWC
jgi:hypothetical protein